MLSLNIFCQNADRIETLATKTTFEEFGYWLLNKLINYCSYREVSHKLAQI